MKLRAAADGENDNRSAKMTVKTPETPAEKGIADSPLSNTEIMWAVSLGTLLFAAVSIIAIDVILRVLFAISPLYSFEMTNYLFAVFCSLSFAISMIYNPHVKIDFIINKFPFKLKTILQILGAISMVYIAFVFAKSSWEVTIRSFNLGAISNSSLGVPIALPQSLWSIGNSLFFLLSLKLLLSTAKQMQRH